jgi:hypothetical protein
MKTWKPANYVEIVTYIILEIREICVFFWVLLETNFESGWSLPATFQILKSLEHWWSI